MLQLICFTGLYFKFCYKRFVTIVYTICIVISFLLLLSSFHSLAPPFLHYIPSMFSHSTYHVCSLSYHFSSSQKPIFYQHLRTLSSLHILPLYHNTLLYSKYLSTKILPFPILSPSIITVPYYTFQTNALYHITVRTNHPPYTYNNLPFTQIKRI